MDTTTLILLTGTALVSFFLSALLGKILIPVLHRLKFGQTIRDDGPAWHKSKQGTPTMGGLIFMLASAVALVAAVLVSQFFLPITKGRIQFSASELLMEQFPSSR